MTDQIPPQTFGPEAAIRRNSKLLRGADSEITGFLGWMIIILLAAQIGSALNIPILKEMNQGLLWGAVIVGVIACLIRALITYAITLKIERNVDLISGVIVGVTGAYRPAVAPVAPQPTAPTDNVVRPNFGKEPEDK